MAESLRENATLLTLKLNMNEVYNIGARALAGMLRENKTLKSLEINTNRMSDGGAAALVEAVHENTTLTKLSFKQSSFFSEAIMLAMREDERFLI